MKENICCITYTTSKYKDVWSMHFGQLTKHLNGLKSYVFSDEGSNDLYQFNEHELLEHSNEDPYWVQYTNSLDKVKEDYVIYLQEDFILYDDIKKNKLEYYSYFLNSTNYDYVRLIRCGYQTPLNRHIIDDIYEVNMNTNDAFSMQATMWKKQSLKNLYKKVKSEKWLESSHWNDGCRDLNIKGTFVYNNEPKKGDFHYDSIIWPYVCTAINRGKWNIDQYPNIMKNMFSLYNVDPLIRGIRKR